MKDCSTDERKCSVAKCVEYSETLMRQKVVVVWVECLLANVVHHRATMLTFVRQMVPGKPGLDPLILNLKSFLS